MHAYNEVLTSLSLAFFVFCVSVKVKLTVSLPCVCVHSACGGRPQNDLYCVGWNVKPYTLFSVILYNNLIVILFFSRYVLCVPVCISPLFQLSLFLALILQNSWICEFAVTQTTAFFFSCLFMLCLQNCMWLSMCCELIYAMGHKKRGTSLLSISSPIIDRFSKFFDWQTLRTICNNVIIIYPTTQ